MSKIIKIDGSLGEGGGQVLRIALSLSALCKIPIEIENIRAGRPKPGLAAQHLKGVELARDMCNASVKGAYIGSTRLEFTPNSMKIKNREFSADTQTAGSICLLAQVALPIALFFPPPTDDNNDSSVCLTLKGGTNVPMAPQVEYLTEVFRPWLNKFGGDFDFTVLKRGYYPKGGGEVQLKVKPVNNKCLNGIEVLNCGEVIEGISGWAYVAGSIHLNEAYKMAREAKEGLIENFINNNITPIPPINIEEYREDRGMAVGNGFGINIVCQTSSGCVFGGSGLGSTKRGAGGLDPVKEAVESIVNSVVRGSCVDNYMQDQLVILMAIANGYSRVSIGDGKITQHTETAIKVAEIMLKDRGLEFSIKEKKNNNDSKYFFMECKGIGLTNNSI